MISNSPEVYNKIIKGANTSIEILQQEISRYEEICELVDSLFNGVNDTKTLLDILTKLKYTERKDIDFLEFCVENGLTNLPTDQYNNLINKLKSVFENYKNFYMTSINNRQSIIEEILMKFTSEELISKNLLELKNCWAHLDRVTENDVIQVLVLECIKTTDNKKDIEQETAIEEVKIEEKETKKEEKVEKKISSKVFKPIAEKLIDKCLSYTSVYNLECFTEINEKIETLISSNKTITEKYGNEIDRSRELFYKLKTKSDTIEYAANQLADLMKKGYRKNYNLLMEKYALLEKDYETFESLVSEYLEIYEKFRAEFIKQINESREEQEKQPELFYEPSEQESIIEEETISDNNLDLIEEAKLILENIVIPSDRGDLLWYKERLLAIMNKDKFEPNDYVEMNEYINQLSPLMKTDDFEEENISNSELNGLGPKNIILFMRNKDDSFTLASDLDSLDGSAVTEARSNVMKTLKRIATRSIFSEIRQNKKIHHIVSESGTKYYVRDKNDRAREFAVNSKGNKKISMYFISVCPENREKLKIELGLEELEGVILIGGYTDNHDIAYLGSEIGANRNYIIEIDEMFKDPNAKIEDLLRIINESSAQFVRLNENNKQL